MKKLLLSIIAAIALLCSSASATQLSVPNTFSNGQVITAQTFNQDFASIEAWANGSIDYSNIGPAGIYASQIACASVGQCTFSSSSGYTFASGVTVVGTLTQDGPANFANTTGFFGPVNLTGLATFLTTPMFGTAGTNTNWATVGISDGSSPSAVSYLTNSSQIVAGVQATCFGAYAYPPGSLWAFDCSGNEGIQGAYHGASAYISGAITSNSLASTSAAIGAITGGSTATGSLAVTGNQTINGSLTITSGTPGYCLALNGSDLVVGQPCSTVQGISGPVSLTSTGNTISVTPSGSTIDLESTATPSPSLVKSQAANNEYMLHGQSTASNAGTTVTLVPAYSSTSSYDCTISVLAGGGPQTYTPNYNKVSGSSIVIYNNPSIIVSYMCLGH